VEMSVSNFKGGFRERQGERKHQKRVAFWAALKNIKTDAVLIRKSQEGRIVVPEWGQEVRDRLLHEGHLFRKR